MTVIGSKYKIPLQVVASHHSSVYAYKQERIKSLRGPKALKNVVGCGCELDALLFM
jgi:hypothetical protein